MRRFFSAMALASFLFAGHVAPASAGVSFGLSIGTTEGFYLGVSNYYGVPRDRVALVVERGLPYDEVPVVFYLAARAHVDPFLVVDLRLAGLPWIDVCHYYGFGADIFYVPIDQPYGPYVTYYQPFLSYPSSAWVTLSLSDVAIVNLTNLRYTSQLYGVPPTQVMRWRARGDNFLRINRALIQQRGDVPSRPLARRWDPPRPLPDRLRDRAVQQVRRVAPVRLRSQLESTKSGRSQPRTEERRRPSTEAPQASAPSRKERTERGSTHASPRGQTMRSRSQERAPQASAPPRKERTERGSTHASPRGQTMRSRSQERAPQASAPRHQSSTKPGTKESVHGKKQRAKDKNGPKD
jgi:hypothetical protein